jgi:hypothetical protein
MREFITIKSDSITNRTIITGNKITSLRSIAEIWNDSTKGEFVGQLKDTGNNIKLQIGDKKLKLDYAEFCDLLDLMVIKAITDENLRDLDSQILEV